MDGSSIAFYGISAFILVAAILSVTTTKIFRASIWLLFCLVGIAGLYFWMQVEFVAAVQIIVYVGGIVVLIIFSIFLTQQSQDMPKPIASRKMFGLLAAATGLLFTFNLIYRHNFKTASAQPFVVTPENIGNAMLSSTEHGFVLPFEVISILLLSCMIGCIVIAMKPTAGNVASTESPLRLDDIDTPLPGSKTVTTLSQLQEADK